MHKSAYNFLSLLLLASLLPLGGCKQREASSVVFSVGGAPSELAVWEELVDDFEAETGISVEIRRQPSDTDQQRQGLIIALKAGITDPDVFMMDVAWLGLFAASGWLTPLDGVDRRPFFPHIIDRVDTFDGQLVALPVYMDGGVLYYRKDLLDHLGMASPPATWQELLSSALLLQRSLRSENPDFYGFVWQGAQYEGLITTFLEFAGSRGGFKRQDGKILLNTEPNRRALAFMRDLIWKYQVSPPNTYTAMKEEEVRHYFQEGDALYERNWPYAWSLHQQPGSPVRGLTGITGVPAFSRETAVSTLGGWHVGISRYSDVPSLALEFVKYITSRKAQKKMVLALGWNPGRQDLYTDPEIVEQVPYLTELKRVFKNARARPLVPYYSQMSAIAQRRINAALAGKYSPAAALEMAESDIAALLARYRLEEETPY